MKIEDLKTRMDNFLNKILCGDCREVMKTFPDDFFDSVITDPPYELGFMGKSWDKSGIAYDVNMWREVLRVSKPGAIMLCFGGSRTFHRIACAIEDSGWQIRDTIMWLYGSGFPKSLDISKAMDKVAGIWRGKAGDVKIENQTSKGKEYFRNEKGPPITAAAAWNGWGTALKPAFEPIIVAMKALDGTFVENALKHGVAGINIDGCRINFQNEDDKKSAVFGRGTNILGGNYVGGVHTDGRKNIPPSDLGRWPANVIFDETAADALDQQAPQTGAFAPVKSGVRKNNSVYGDYAFQGDNSKTFHGDGLAGASRFFYTAKADKTERNIGLENFKPKAKCDLNKMGGKNCTMKTGSGNDRNTEYKNFHPTVKPLDLMEYLCRLTKTPTGGIVLDPFIGSGTTALACINTGRDFTGIDLEADHVKIAEARIKAISTGVPIKEQSKNLNQKALFA